MVAGAMILFGFVLWERHLTRRPGGQPLVDLALFRSAAFTWGVILSSTVDDGIPSRHVHPVFKTQADKAKPLNGLSRR